MKKIVLNPGHGGPDPGCIGYAGTREADLTHAVSHRAGALLENYYQVINTRDYGAVELEEVVALANKAKADVFVSIHYNSTKNQVAEGLEAYHFKGSKTGYELAQEVYISVAKAAIDSGYTFVPRGIKSSNFYVLRKTIMPACLIECGFLSNPKEEKWLASPLGQIVVGFGIAKGIMKYLEG